MTWHVCTVAPRRETSVVSELQALGLDAYCPMQARWQGMGKRGQVRRRRVISPIVSGYVFINIDGPFQLASAEACADLIDFLRYWSQGANVPYPVKPDWIVEMRSDEANGAFDLTIDRSPQLRMKAGERCRILAGKFAGMLATIKEVRKSEFKLEVDPAGNWKGQKVTLPKMDVEAA